MLIDNTYFIGELRIEGLVISEGTAIVNQAQKAIADNVQYYINRYEKEYIINLLGLKLGSEFISYISTEGDSNNLFDFLRLKLSDRISPAAMYVYCKYQRAETIISVASMSDDVDANRTLGNTGRMIVWAWNNMVEINHFILLEAHLLTDQIETDPNVLSYINSMNL